MNISKSTLSYFGLRFIATGKNNGGLYFLVDTIFQSGDQGLPPHTHLREQESFYVQDGVLTFTVNDEEIIIKRGEFFTIVSGEKHSWRNSSDIDARVLVIFSPAGIEDMFIELEHNFENMIAIGRKYRTDFSLDK